ncbi:MAG: GNAT family N-acetyltransferase [Patescibacteria group bacterium]
MKFTIDTISIDPILLQDIGSLQNLAEKSKDYIELVEGRPLRESDAGDMLLSLPDGKQMEDKYVLAIREGEAFIGVIDVIKDYPKANIWFIGLLLLDPEYRNKGLGRKIYTGLKAELKSRGDFESIQISVFENNTQALEFWKKLGFVEISSKIEQKAGKEMKFIYLEDK